MRKLHINWRNEGCAGKIQQDVLFVFFVMKDLRGWQDYPESAHGAAGHGYSHSRWVERWFTDLHGSNADE